MISTRLLFGISNFVETRCAYLQGKGYGTASIRREVALARKVLAKTPRLVIDIGGNIGNYTAEFLCGIPGLEVHVFEPALVNVDVLRARFSNDAGVKIVPAGLSNSSGVATLYSNAPGSGLGSLAKRDLQHFNIEFEHTETVRVVRFEDYWIRELDCRPIDVVKLDIEGHELTALEGFGKSASAVNVFQFEFGGCNIDTRTYFRDFWNFFNRLDFAIYRITPFGLESIDRYRENCEAFRVTNFIAANRQKV